jgi:hypothetical protein
LPSDDGRLEDRHQHADGHIGPPSTHALHPGAACRRPQGQDGGRARRHADPRCVLLFHRHHGPQPRPVGGTERATREGNQGILRPHRGDAPVTATVRGARDLAPHLEGGIPAAGLRDDSDDRGGPPRADHGDGTEPAGATGAPQRVGDNGARVRRPRGPRPGRERSPGTPIDGRRTERTTPSATCDTGWHSWAATA